MCAGGVEMGVCIAMGVRWGCQGGCVRSYGCTLGVSRCVCVHSYGCALGVLRCVCA